MYRPSSNNQTRGTVSTRRRPVIRFGSWLKFKVGNATCGNDGLAYFRLMEPSDRFPIDHQKLAGLEARIGSLHLQRRLGVEREHEARIAAHWSTRVISQAEWSSMHGLMRVVLTLAGLHRRGRHNVLDIRRRDNVVRLARLPDAFEGFTLLHLSDLHLDMSAPYLERLIGSVKGLDHNVCVLTGDFRFRTFGPYQPALDALARLRPHLGGPVYAVLGNHDTIRMVPEMEALDIRVLMNEAVHLRHGNDSLTLAGIDDAHTYRTHDFDKLQAALGPASCAILLSHTPEPYRKAAHVGFSLMLSGHTHGGQICLPGGLPVFTDTGAPRALARGAWKYRNMVGYTSVGCGSSLIDVRLNCHPEITLHCLHRCTTGLE